MTFPDNIFGALIGLSCESVSICSIDNKLNIVFPTTFPKIVCFLFNQLHLSKVIKNCDPLSLAFPGLA